jgi:hypothetical protein
MVDTPFGPFVERKLVGQPRAGIQKRLGPGGMEIIMYNADPGVYLNERGGRVSEEMARAVGFDVDTLGKARRRLAALKVANEAVEEEFEGQPNSKVVLERGEYRMTEIALGLFAIGFIEADGKTAPLTTVPLSRKAADKLFDQLAGPPDADNHL